MKYYSFLCLFFVFAALALTCSAWSFSPVVISGRYFIFQKNNLTSHASLRPYCPTPTEQGTLPASAAHALCQALSIQRNKQRGQVDSVGFSASWLFNSLKKGQDCNTGVKLSEALDWLKKRGTCTLKFFPNSRYCCQPAPDERHLPPGALHRIKGYARLFRSEDGVSQKIEAVRQRLGSEKNARPAVVVMATNLGFDALASASGDWRLAPLAPAQPMQYEAFVVVGYDDDAQTFELMGSYGTAWGEGGFARIAYRDFGDLARFGAVMEAGKFRW